MLKPFAIPSTPDRASWERVRASFIAAEMDSGTLTPAAAAAAGDARTQMAFGSLFPGKELPLPLSAPSRASGQPGGLRTGDGRTWVVISRPEDDRSVFPEAERIDAGLLRAMAESYDPVKVHRAPIVLPENGPAHFVGEHAKAMAGDVDGLEYDGYHLWSLVRDRGGRLAKAVSDGLGNRSIRWWPSFPAAGGAPYLRHLAVMAEPAGTDNLGLLDDYFTNEQAASGRSQTDINDLTALATCARSLGDLPDIDADAVAAAKENAMATETKGTDVEQLVAAEVQRALAAVPKPQTPAPDETSRAIAAAAEKLFAPLMARLEASEAKTAELTANAAKKAADDRAVHVRSTLERLVYERRLAPAQRDMQADVILSAPAEAGDKALAALAAMPVQVSNAPIATIMDPETGAELTPPQHLTAPPETGLVADDAYGLKVEAAARAAAEKEADPAQRAAVYEREILRGYGQAPAASSPSFLN